MYLSRLDACLNCETGLQFGRVLHTALKALNVSSGSIKTRKARIILQSDKTGKVAAHKEPCTRVTSLACLNAPKASSVTNVNRNISLSSAETAIQNVKCFFRFVVR